MSQKLSSRTALPGCQCPVDHLELLSHGVIFNSICHQNVCQSHNTPCFPIWILSSCQTVTWTIVLWIFLLGLLNKDLVLECLNIRHIVLLPDSFDVFCILYVDVLISRSITRPWYNHQWSKRVVKHQSSIHPSISRSCWCIWFLFPFMCSDDLMSRFENGVWI